MFRRPVVLALSLVVLFGVVACGDDSDAETEGSAVPLADADGLPGTSWVLTEYTDASGDTVPAVDEPASLSFTTDAVAGSTPCNQFNGSYTVDGDALDDHDGSDDATRLRGRGASAGGRPRAAAPRGRVVRDR